MKTEVEILRDVLVSQREWIDHWMKDRRCNLLPTSGSLASAKAEIDLALFITRSARSIDLDKAPDDIGVRS